MATPQPLRRRPGTQWVQCREQMRTIPRLIFILKQASSPTRWRKTLVQKMATIWWQEFTRKSHTSPPVHLQENRKRTALPVNRNSAENTPCHHWTVHLCQNASTPEDIIKSGPLWKWHVWTDCHTPRKRIRVEWFGSQCRATDKHCEPTTHKH